MWKGQLHYSALDLQGAFHSIFKWPMAEGRNMCSDDKDTIEHDPGKNASADVDKINRRRVQQMRREYTQQG